MIYKNKSRRHNRNLKKIKLKKIRNEWWEWKPRNRGCRSEWMKPRRNKIQKKKRRNGNPKKRWKCGDEVRESGENEPEGERDEEWIKGEKFQRWRRWYRRVEVQWESNTWQVAEIPWGVGRVDRCWRMWMSRVADSGGVGLLSVWFFVKNFITFYFEKKKCKFYFKNVILHLNFL